MSRPVPEVCSGSVHASAAKPHFVYMIEDEQCRTKIGHSRDPYKRLGNLSTASPELMHVAHQWACTRPKALVLEAALHSLFRWAHLRGEWFQVDMEDVIAIGDAVLAGNMKLARRGAKLVETIYEAHEEDDEETVEDCLRDLAGLGITLDQWVGSYPQRQRGAA